MGLLETPHRKETKTRKEKKVIAMGEQVILAAGGGDDGLLCAGEG